MERGLNWTNERGQPEASTPRVNNEQTEQTKPVKVQKQRGTVGMAQIAMTIQLYYRQVRWTLSSEDMKSKTIGYNINASLAKTPSM